MKPLVYIAGPITKPNQMQNLHRACHLGREFLQDGYIVPFIPHLSIPWESITPDISYEDWLAYDFDVIRRCQGLFRMEGESPGADREVEFAESIGTPVFTHRGRLYAWAIEVAAGRCA